MIRYRVTYSFDGEEISVTEFELPAPHDMETATEAALDEIYDADAKDPKDLIGFSVLKL